MKPASFEYAAPQTLTDALALKAQYAGDCRVLAGGQSLIPAMNFRLAQPMTLIDINGISELSYIRAEQNELRIGAMTRNSTLERSDLVHKFAPLMAEAMPLIAHPQIRNRGTIGGSLAHADPAAEMPVLAVALNARLRAQNAQSDRWISANEFFLGLFTTALEADELLVEIAIPQQAARTGNAFVEFARRHGDYALMGVAAVISLDENGACTRAKLVYLNAGPGPMVATQAAASLIQQKISETHIEQAARIASQNEIEPMGNMHATVEYQRHLAFVLTRRALRMALERAQKS